MIHEQWRLGWNTTVLLAFVLLASALSCGAKSPLLVWPSDAQVPSDATDAVAGRTYLGTEFWAVTTANGRLQLGNRFHFAVAIGNPNPDAVTATIEGGALAAPLTVQIAANSTETTQLPWVRELVQNSGETPGCTGRLTDGNVAHSERVDRGAYHIRTSAPVSVYQFNPLEYAVGTGGCSSYTNDASLLLPTTALTGRYLVLTHGAYGAPGSFVAIAGAGGSTVNVTVTLPCSTSAGTRIAGGAPGQVLTYSLAPGNVVQLVADGLSQSDMTGATITATGPVAVFAGVDCTTISWPNGSQGACDHLEEQLFPEETWGTRYVVPQLRDRTPTEGSVIRVLSREPGNRITFTPNGVHAPVTLGRGEHVEFEATTDVLIESSLPALVAQFMEGQETTPRATMGDPAMILAVPVEQYRQDYEFVIPASYTSSMINVVFNHGTTVLLDGRPLPNFAQMAGTQWDISRVAVRPGSHSLAGQNGARAGLGVLGVAPFTSYMYPGGLDLAQIH